MDSSEEESDYDFELQHWNNWSEPKNEFTVKQSFKETTNSHYVYNMPGTVTGGAALSDSRFGNWIPPVSFNNFNGSRSFCAKKNNGRDIKLKQTDVAQKDDSAISCKWKVNEDWGERVDLNDVTKFNEGDIIWGVVNLGLFGRIKLWVNEYENICVFAEGTLSKVGSTEATLISIVKTELLRKMLCLSSAQWASLCDEVLELKASLNFDAFLEFNITNQSSLDKMWFFICKRRHFLQDQCMLVKLSGAVKCMKRFEVIPKLVVQDIRNLMGESIS